jgi:ribosomal protein L37E
MTRIELDMPRVCSKCGFFNFNVSGVSYNRDFNYTVIKVTCMRCGNPEREIKVENIKAEKTA